MKAILVIDMPNECIECNQFVFECCHAMKRQIEHENIVQCKRPSWCPLKPIPDKVAEMLLDGLDKIESIKNVQVSYVNLGETE